MIDDQRWDDRTAERRATVIRTAGGEVLAPGIGLAVGQQLTFGRGRTVDLQFSRESRLSRLAGSVRGLVEGVAITNLSSTHDLHVSSESDTIRLAATTADRPTASLLLASGPAHITWPGGESTVLIEIEERRVPVLLDSARNAGGASTFHPLTLNSATKEFAVALLLCQPRLRAVPGSMATPSVPDLTRQVLLSMSSFRLLHDFDTDKIARARLTARTHEHLKNLRDKLVRAELAADGQSLSPESIADLLVDHNVLRTNDLDLLHDADWLSLQEREWEQ